MTDLKTATAALGTIADALEANDFVIDYSANTGPDAVEYVRVARDGTQTTVLLDHTQKTVTKKRFNRNDVQTDSATISLTRPGGLSLGLAMAS